jgi:hypothetical protein
VAASVLMLLGICLFSGITATITSQLLSHDSHLPDATPAGDRASSGEPARPSAPEKTTAGKGSSSAGGSLVSELERLAALHRAGDLTRAEFNEAKRQSLLGRMNREET